MAYRPGKKPPHAVAFCLAPQQGDQQELDARRAARQQQAQVAQRRLMRHQEVAETLLTAPPAQARAMVADAQAVVSHWAEEGLCSADYVQRWTALLALPLPQLALAMTGDADGWGEALRQNSPWVQALGGGEAP
ncbi:hypothetical protein [Ideonella sp.]|jgi:hypothetical protein|uniref:hypothetical protein n=1 Tax=Ideonella sp. TaxID=1929293 RepID=UPI0037C003E4